MSKVGQTQIMARGIAPLGIILILALLGVGAVGGLAGTALLGKAPECPSAAGAARSEKELGNLLEKSGSVTTADGEATTIAQKYVAGKVTDGRVCFTPNLAHASGKIALGPVTPSFYASAGIDLSGTTPKTVNLDIKVGSMPDVPVVSDQAKNLIEKLINDNLAKVTLDKKYSIQFSQGSATVNKLSK